ncbi:lysozyme [bacterium]|nr:lysozyme [bacterium]
MRIQVAALSLSAAALVGIAVQEGYRGEAYEPVKGDVPTIGFGTTEGVEMGDKTTPERALVTLLRDANKFEKSVRKCAPVPMYQYEFDAYVSLTYNIGQGAFCKSEIAKKLNAGDYSGACEGILRWDKFNGRPLPGLTKRRQEEYKKCLGS